MKTLAIGAGEHISSACKMASVVAEKSGESVTFTFNDTEVTAQPGDSAADLEARWQADFNAAAKTYRESDECKQAEARREEEYRQKCAAPMREAATTEKEMRNASVPWPLTEAQLAEYIKSLVDRKHDYGTCCHAMSMAAVAAFQYVAHKIGTTGFQASCADLDILRRTRGMEGPFILLKAEDALYPQYNLPGKLAKAMEEWRPWLAEEAAKKLAKDGTNAHPDVVRHWERLAGGAA